MRPDITEKKKWKNLFVAEDYYVKNKICQFLIVQGLHDFFLLYVKVLDLFKTTCRPALTEYYTSQNACRRIA